MSANPLRNPLTLLPSLADYQDVPRTWRGDLVAGATVGVVALPLALAFGITTGLGAASGLVTAIVAGVVAGIFGGSNVQVSGPTGAMTVVLVPIVARYGTDAVFTVSILAGLLIVLTGVLRLGRYLEYIPWPVFEGFTIGIAIIIFLQQVPNALGVPKPDGENTAVVAFRAVQDSLDHGQRAAVAIVLLVTVTMIGVLRVRKSLPGSLLAVILATGLAEIGGLDVARIGELPSSLPSPALPAMDSSELRTLMTAAFAVAALAAIESLLSAKVADGMSDARPHNPDRELIGQGLANIASPLFGGMPATGAIARTAVNVRSGAQTRLSTLVHAVVLLLVVYFGTGLVSRIPLAALAGVLMVTAFRMAERHNVVAVIRSTRSDAVVLILTALCTVAFDLIVAVEVGVVAAALLALRQLAKSSEAATEPLGTHVELSADDERALLHEKIAVYRLDGALFFGAAQNFLSILTQTTEIKVVILRTSQIRMLDATGAKALGMIIGNLEGSGIAVIPKGVRAEHAQILRAVGALNQLRLPTYSVSTMGEAIALARTIAHPPDILATQEPRTQGEPIIQS